MIDISNILFFLPLLSLVPSIIVLVGAVKNKRAKQMQAAQTPLTTATDPPQASPH